MLTLAKDDLTSAALVTLMRISFAEQGIEIDATGGLRWGGGPHASLSAKSATADAVLARHGPVALLKVGRAIPRMAFDPIGAALLSASDGQDLLARWLRLERYVHTLHPILMRSVTATSARLVHQRGSDGTPNVAVNLILAGVICGLLGAVGCRRLSLAIGSGPIKTNAIVDDRITIADRIDPRLATGIWSIRWTNTPLERLLPPPPSLAPWKGRMSEVGRRVAKLLEADLLRAWTISATARELALSPRTLQRRLTTDGASLQVIRREARIKHATELLLRTDNALNTIGFVCGFSDSAHFTRAFKARAGMTPTAFREAVRPGE
jgi:AraC-like DNA-binding protein